MFAKSQRVQTVVDLPDVPAGTKGTVIDVCADRGGDGYFVLLDDGTTIPTIDEDLQALSPSGTDGLGDSHSTNEIERFIQAGLDQVYPGRWVRLAPGFGSRVELEDLGILVVNLDDRVHFASGILTGLRLSEDLVRRVAAINCATPAGALILSEGAPGEWAITYGYKLLPEWVEPASRASAVMVANILARVPIIVRSRGTEIQQEFGGIPWGVQEGWWFLLMDRY